jgi:hypothetical protein
VRFILGVEGGGLLFFRFSAFDEQALREAVSYRFFESGEGCCAFVRRLFNQEFLELPIREIAALLINGKIEEVRTLNTEPATW